MANNTTTTTSSQPLIPKITSAGTNPAAPLRSTFSVLAAAGEPVATVRVRNLQAVIPCGRDAWGRPGKAQPVLLSSELSFRSPFSASSADDRLVDSETAHYGNLSKTLLGGLEGLGGPGSTTTTTTTEPSQEPSSPSSSAVFELLWVRLTGRVPDGSTVALPPDQVPFLDASTLRSLSLTINLPKASLLGGGGVSLTTTAAFKAKSALIPGTGNNDDDDDDEDQVKNPIDAYARTLRISGLHVPTLVGVNANEREARQMLVAEVEIDRFDVTGEDVHDQIERVIVDVSKSKAMTFLFIISSLFTRRFFFFLPLFLFTASTLLSYSTVVFYIILHGV